MTTITVPRQLLEQAIDAVQELQHSNSTTVSYDKATAIKQALRAALAQQAEPSGWTDSQLDAAHDAWMAALVDTKLTWRDMMRAAITAAMKESSNG